MARILIDCTHIDFSRQPTGIPRVVLRYIEEGYSWANETGHEVIPVVPTSSGLWLCRPVPGESPPDTLVAMAKASEAFEAASLAVSQSGGNEGTRPPHLIVPTAGDILFSPSYWHDNDPQIYLDIKAAGCRIAILVHDILPIAFKHFYNAPWRYSFAASVLQAIDYADQLYCVSATTKTQLEDFAARRGRTLPPTEVAYNGMQPLVSEIVQKRILEGRLSMQTDDPAARKVLLDGAPLIMVGSVEPKKGHVPVIKVLEAMWTAGYSRNLLVIGRPGWMEAEIVNYINRSPFLGTKLFWMSGIADFDLAYLYMHSHALLFASFAEGFGLPMVEAGTLGKPVVVLDSPISREVLGEKGLFFDDAAKLMRALVRLEDSDAYEAACRDIATFSWPNWDQLVPRLMDDLVSATNMPAAREVDFASPPVI